MMLLYAFGAVGLVAVSSLMLCRTHRIMQGVSILHALSYLLLVGYALAFVKLPSYGLFGGYLFIDHLGLFEVMIASLVFMFSATYAGGYVESLIQDGELKRDNLLVFYMSFNVLLIATVMSYFADNLALFWIFAELTTFFSAILIAILNSRKNIEASLRYVFVTSIAMLFTFIGLIFLFTLAKYTTQEGTLNWSVLMTIAPLMPPKLLTTTLILVFIGFAAKAGISPLHTWLPHAHGKAPSAVSAILSGALLNVGMYGIIRINAIAGQNEAASQFSSLLVIFGTLSIFIASFTMLRQKNLKKLIAFSSIEHMGIMLLGLGIGTPVAVFWVLYHTLAHSLTKTLLFLSAGILHRQYHGNKYSDMKDVLRLQPIASLGLILGAVSIVGLPPFPIFASKFFLLIQVGNYSMPLLLSCLLMLLVAAVSLSSFLLKVFQQVSEHKPGAHMRSYVVHQDMSAPILALMALLVCMGLIYPHTLSVLLETIVSQLRLIR